MHALHERVEEDWRTFDAQQRAETEQLVAAEQVAFELGVAAAEAAADDDAAAREPEEARCGLQWCGSLQGCQGCTLHSRSVFPTLLTAAHTLAPSKGQEKQRTHRSHRFRSSGELAADAAVVVGLQAGNATAGDCSQLAKMA